ncbi:MAG TPA: DNA polymerase III subunit gamma/tau, partial [Candidatus Acidoferrales bacterium]|nr:DNA polymerase III subunit gamma/tau [Candidatus Acidoferrales bacterium]
MSYQVIARKWRPQTFADVVGQEHVTRTLSNAIQSGRVAHAYIFSGARGVGKTTTARILAKALNCAKGPGAEPCNECDSCREIGQGNSLDVIEIDAASNRGIDQIRELREMVRYAPAGGRYKVVILDEAHALTGEASNALLKTLEEPPDKVIFIMATTQPEDLVDTIRSRSQHFHFRALSFTEISDALNDICKKEGLTAEPGALAVMARAAEGSVRDGLSLLEQARAYCGTTITDEQVRKLLGVVPGEILDELTQSIEQHSAERVLSLVHRLLAEGQNLQHFCREAIGHFRNLLVARVCGADSELIAAPIDERPGLGRAAEFFSEEDLTRFFQILLHTDDDLRRKPDPRLHLEMGLLRMVNAARLAPLEELLAELDNGTPATSAPRGNSSALPQTSAAARSSAAPATISALWQTSSGSQGAATATAPAKIQPVMASTESRVPFTAAREEIKASPQQIDATLVPAPAVTTDSVARPTAGGSEGVSEQVNSIKSAIVSQEKFLGELVVHASRWELQGGEVRIFFSTENRVFSEMLQARDPMERLRNIATRILGQPARVCVKLEDVPATGAQSTGPNGSDVSNASSGARELRAQFEQDPIVR